MPFYGGQPIFGYAVKVKKLRDPDASQVNAFFGASGVQTLFGGTRGWALLIEGTFFGPDPATVVAIEGVFLSYSDGIGRVFVDDFGRVFPDAVFTGQYEGGDQNDIRPMNVGGVPGWGMRYKAVFRSKR